MMAWPDLVAMVMHAWPPVIALACWHWRWPKRRSRPSVTTRFGPPGLTEPASGREAVDWHEALERLVRRLHAALKGCTEGSCYRVWWEALYLATAELTDPTGLFRLWEAPHTS